MAIMTSALKPSVSPLGVGRLAPFGGTGDSIPGGSVTCSGIEHGAWRPAANSLRLSERSLLKLSLRFLMVWFIIADLAMDWL